MTDKIKIAWWGLYSGEESPLLGEKGMGERGIIYDLDFLQGH